MHEVKTNFWQYCFGLDRCYIVWPLVNSAVALYNSCDGNFPNKIACFFPFTVFPVVCFGQKKRGWIFHDQQTRSIRIYFISKWMFIWYIRLPQNGDGISVKSIRTRNQRICNFYMTIFFLLLPKIQFQNEFPSAVELLMVFILNILYTNIFVFVKLFYGYFWLV